MDIGPILLALALSLLVAGFVARPLLERAGASGDQAASSDLITQREAVFTELRELDFDHSTGKLADDDYQAQRARLVAKGTEILRALDQLPRAAAPAAAALDDDIERLVAARRLRAPAAANVPASLDDDIEQRVAARRQKAGAGSSPDCPKCRRPVQAGDKFCPHCGAKLA